MISSTTLNSFQTKVHFLYPLFMGCRKGILPWYWLRKLINFLPILALYSSFLFLPRIIRFLVSGYRNVRKYRLVKFPKSFEFLLYGWTLTIILAWRPDLIGQFAVYYCYSCLDVAGLQNLFYKRQFSSKQNYHKFTVGGRLWCHGPFCRLWTQPWRRDKHLVYSFEIFSKTFKEFWKLHYVFFSFSWFWRKYRYEKVWISQIYVSSC